MWTDFGRRLCDNTDSSWSLTKTRMSQCTRFLDVHIYNCDWFDSCNKPFERRGRKVLLYRTIKAVRISDCLYCIFKSFAVSYIFSVTIKSASGQFPPCFSDACGIGSFKHHVSLEVPLEFCYIRRSGKGRPCFYLPLT